MIKEMEQINEKEEIKQKINKGKNERKRKKHKIMNEQ